MKILTNIFSVIPLALIGYVLVFALFKGVDCYSSFISGVKSAIPMLLRILPYICAMMAAISLLRASGALDFLTSQLSRLLSPLGIPGELMPLFLLKPFSGSASLSLLSDVLASHGADSFIGRCACVLIGSSETIFYTVALYLGCVGVKNSRYIIPVSLFCAVVGLVSSVLVVQIFY